MILDDEEKNPEKYKDKEFLESFFNAPYDEEHSIEHTEVYYKKSWLPKTIMVKLQLLGPCIMKC